MASVKYNGQEIFRVNTGESKYRVITDTVAKIANWKVKEITGKDFADVFGKFSTDWACVFGEERRGFHTPVVHWPGPMHLPPWDISTGK